MRIIKFRGKSIETGKWVYGDLLQYRVYPVIFDKNRIQHEVYADSVGQYIGRDDINKNPIYEGDIVRDGEINEPMWDNKAICIQECKGIVKYERVGYDLEMIQRGIAKWVKSQKYCEIGEEWDFTEDRYDGVYEGWGSCEVIGNKTDNPELLEVKDV